MRAGLAFFTPMCYNYINIYGLVYHWKGVCYERYDQRCCKRSGRICGNGVKGTQR